VTRLQTEALVVRTVEYGESDLVVTFLTESVGKLGAIVRGGRKSSRRVGGALEPFHSIEATLEDKGGDLAALREARITKMRHGIVASLDAMDAAGTALRWARHLFPPRTREVDGYAVIVALLDRLDEGAPPRAELAGAGLRLLAAVGYALDFDRCVTCGKACPPGKASGVDAARGGLVCRACGGGRRTLDGEARAVAMAFQRGERGQARAEHVGAVLALVDEAMAAHAEFER
jgi:DNA repair protein RecO (recombination protein O)